MIKTPNWLSGWAGSVIYKLVVLCTSCRGRRMRNSQ